MLPTFPHAGRTYAYDPAAPLDISLPLVPGADQVSCFWAEPVQFDTIRVGSFVGSVALGGSTNYQRVHLTPHGNDTHTECYGHISPDPAATLNQCLRRFLFVARLVSVAPRPQPNGDLVVTLADVQAVLASGSPSPWERGVGGEVLLPEALVLRTLPNDDAKRTRHYSGTNPTYTEPALAHFLVDNNVQHFLLDLPSVDREEDAGQLLAHRAFWCYPAQPRCGATITELVFVPDAVSDGLYLLNIQITSLELDASPSKPVLYRLNAVPAA
ncbi:MAG: cyclase family protein [Hymenobacter sp.]|nr:cyclase family protein [Hymenobacter sp.]